MAVQHFQQVPRSVPATIAGRGGYDSPMQPIVLNNAQTGTTARILAEAGFNLFQLRIPVGNQTVEVLDADPSFETTGASPSHSGIPLLFPFPNRIGGARYQWEGR